MKESITNKNGIDLSIIEDYTMSSEKEKKILDSCIFIFDTSALFNIYYFSQKAQNEIFNKIFKKFKNRLWIPHHVQYEYLINREKTMLKPISEKYEKLETDQINPLKKKIKEIENNFIDLKNKTDKNETHPYMNPDAYIEFEKAINFLKEKSGDFFEKIDDEISMRKLEISSLVHTDTVFEEIKKHFTSGREYTYTEINKIMQEGKNRYADKIPPGYEDEIRNNKVGIQKYGDLIIWNQIIEFAKQKKLPVILISNDLKSDWCYPDKNHRELRINKPREELIKEIRDKADVSFWMYSFPQFLYKAKKILEIEIEANVLEEAKESVKNLNENIVYNKYYISAHGNSYSTYLKFRKNGTVQIITTKEMLDAPPGILQTDEDVKGFNEEYEIDGNKISFIVDTSIGMIEFKGTILSGNKIVFEIYSHVNGTTGKETFVLLNQL